MSTTHPFVDMERTQPNLFSGNGVIFEMKARKEELERRGIAVKAIRTVDDFANVVHLRLMTDVQAEDASVPCSASSAHRAPQGAPNEA